MTQQVRPNSVDEALAAWDAGHEVETVEMGGIGEAYEMAIQCVTFELVRALHTDVGLREMHDKAEIGKPFPQEFRDRLDAIITDLDAKQPDGSYKLGGLSGSQAGAAKNLALNLIRNGWQSAREQVPDRLIFVRKQDPVAMYRGEKAAGVA